MTPYDQRQRIITAQSCQKDAIEIIKLRRILRREPQKVTNKELMVEVHNVRDELFQNLHDNYGEQKKDENITPKNPKSGK